MIKLSVIEKAVHDQAVDIVTRRTRDEASLIMNLQRNEQIKLYKKFGRTSLFKYAVLELKLTESVALSFINVARKARAIPSLQNAIKNYRLSVPKASRMVSALKPENANQLVEFAIQNSCAKIDQEVARIHPKSRSREKVRWINEDLVELTITVCRKAFENLSRTESLAAQKGKKFSGRGEAVEEALSEYVERHDPVRKAERALKKKQRIEGQKTKEIGAEVQKTTANVDRAAPDEIESSPARNASPAFNQALEITNKTDSQFRLNRVPANSRVRLHADIKHTVVNADQGRCTFVDSHGQRCDSDRFLHIHHIIPISEGGTNDPSNLTTLCSSHHDLVHQLSFRLENQGAPIPF